MTAIDRDGVHRRADRMAWLAYWLAAVTLYAATFAIGDLVQRYQLRGWTRTTGTVVTDSDSGVAVRYDVRGESRESPLPGWRGTHLEGGATVDLWHHPRNASKVILTDNTPLNSLPISLALGLPSGVLAAWFVRRSLRLRRATRAAAIDTRPLSASTTAAREWLAAAAALLSIAVGSLGWLAANPEIEGETQLGLALAMYLAASFGVYKWLQAQRPA